MATKAEIQHNFQKITDEFKAFPKAQLIAVSKTQSVDAIRTLYQLGQRHFGENRVEELSSKVQELAALDDIHWHFIGTFQSNKLKPLWDLPVALTIHSLASYSHVQKVVAHATRPRAYAWQVLLQINTGGESEKSGFDPGSPEYDKALALLAQSQAPFVGLMTMAPIRVANLRDAASQSFAMLAQMAREGKVKYPQYQWLTSMGMSGDYALALASGANYLRIGSLLFQPI